MRPILTEIDLSPAMCAAIAPHLDKALARLDQDARIAPYDGVAVVNFMDTIRETARERRHVRFIFHSSMVAGQWVAIGRWHRSGLHAQLLRFAIHAAIATDLPAQTHLALMFRLGRLCALLDVDVIDRLASICGEETV